MTEVAAAPLRLAVVRQRYNPFGGAERFVERATRSLAARGTAISVIAREWSQREGTMPAGVRWLECNPRYLGRRARDANFARAACALVEREAFDLVQSHERIACCDIFRAGDGVHRQWLEYRARALGRIGRWALAVSPYHRYVLDAEAALFASPRLRAVICNSQMVRADIMRHYRFPIERLHVIYNGVDTERFHPRARLAHRDRMRERLGIGANTFLYLFVGSGFARKGVPQLLRALALAVADNCCAVIVGKDKATNRMARLADRLGLRGRVHFVGPQSDVLPWYAMADAFVLPTLYDPFPNAVLEALATGLPIVVSTQCGAAELVTAGENGFVCDPLDQPALAGALESVRGLQSDQANAAARASVESLSLDAMARALLTLYGVLMAGQGR